MNARFFVPLAMLVALAGSAAAQEAPAREGSVTPPSPAASNVPGLDHRTYPLASTTMSIGYATGGVIAGLAIASKFPCASTDNPYHDTCRDKDYAAALAGGALLGAVGAHVGNRFRGSLAADVGVGAATALAGMAVQRRTHDNWLIPVAALGVTALVVTEHVTSRPRPAGPTRAELDAIPAYRIASETTPKYSTLYGLGGGILGGTGGMFAGAIIGYNIAYPRDIAGGCEDCGLGGVIIGGLVGGVTGALTGALLGAGYGHRVDREEAAARILSRR